jgi:hypothetical protein
MKAKPVKLITGKGYTDCAIEEATHVTINIPGPVGELTLPVILRGSREGTNCWTWNGSVDLPTLKPSVLHQGCYQRFSDASKGVNFVCHTWINDGKAQFLSDSTHEHAGKTLDLLDVEVSNVKLTRPPTLNEEKDTEL